MAKTGEAALFAEIWYERPHYCVNCTKPLPEPMRAFYFSHRKGKGAHPELRLDKNNIDLLCFDCHRERDQGTHENFKRRGK